MEVQQNAADIHMGQRRDERGDWMKASGWARWLLAATVVFQASATIGARLSPPETFTAVPLPRRSASGR